MNKIEIKLFDRFQIIVDGRELPLAPSAKELIALLVIGGGYRITAKGLWKILYEYKGIKYNSTFYTDRLSDLCSELKYFHITDLVFNGCTKVRFCRINMDVVHCDYYDMLDGIIPFRKEEKFLPEYRWAKALYHNSWANLCNYLDSLKI